MRTFYIRCELMQTEDKNIPEIWCIIKTSVPGLNLEGRTLPELLHRAADAIPLLLELNGEHEV